MLTKLDAFWEAFLFRDVLVRCFQQPHILPLSVSGQQDACCMGRKFLVYQAKAVFMTKVAAVKAAVTGWALQIASVPEIHWYSAEILHIYYCIYFSCTYHF